MEKTTLISEMQKFHFGSKIVCTDGEDGALTQVGFERESRRMNLIGVRLGRFFGRTVFLPFSAITRASGEGIILNVTRAELAAADSTVPGGALFDQKSSIQRVGGGASGTLVLAAVEPGSGELAYIVARNLRSGQDTQVRQEHVKELLPGRAVVTISDNDLQALPPYRSDEELQREVEEIVFDLTPLHIDLKGIRMRVLDSVLYLDGNISSSLRGDMVVDQAQGVQGLLEIENLMVGDDTLAGGLALALARDARTRALPIGVYPRLGHVRLGGSVSSGEQREVAEEIARSFPNVRSVINDLVVNPGTNMLHVMSPAESGQSQDIVPGKYVRHTK